MFPNLPLSTISLSQIKKTHKRYNFDRVAIDFSITVYAQIGKYTSTHKGTGTPRFSTLPKSTVFNETFQKSQWNKANKQITINLYEKIEHSQTKKKKKH